MDQPRRRPSAWRVRLAFAAVALGLLLLFILVNYRTVEIRFVIATVETKLAWALLIAAALGAVLGWLFPRLRR